MITKEAWSLEIDAMGYGNPQSTVKRKDIEKVLPRLGWEKDRKSGHTVWVHPKIRWVLTVPGSPSKYLSNDTLRNILQAMGISKNDLQFLQSKRQMKNNPERLQQIVDEAPARASDASLYGFTRS